MFGWRKKPDRGFEWHKYIRTTIKLRRDARRQRIVEARRAAGQQMQAAGVALAAGSRAAGGAAREGARAGLGALGLALQAIWSFVIYLLRTTARLVGAVVSRPGVGIPVALLGAVAVGAAIGRWRILGLDREAVATLVAGLVLMASLLAVLFKLKGWSLPGWAATGAAAVAATALIGGAVWYAGAGSLGSLGSHLAALGGNLPLIGGGKSVAGRAYATGADSLRIGRVTVRLAGIEAPESEQRCGAEDSRWRCSAVAQTVLSRLVGGRRVECSVSGSDGAGRALGHCSVGRKDVGAELVRQGYVFSDGSFLARYAGEEYEAREAKAGLWSGSVERPGDFRAKLWEEARRKAPDGCPIKGQVSGGSRVYVLPWSADYERVRVQKARGERWFCSEQEAVAAGFKVAQRG
jgi:endonuclease YncB( thermonuclease family)